jgi:hypothetical protein
MVSVALSYLLICVLPVISAEGPALCLHDGNPQTYAIGPPLVCKAPIEEGLRIDVGFVPIIPYEVQPRVCECSEITVTRTCTRYFFGAMYHETTVTRKPITADDCKGLCDDPLRGSSDIEAPEREWVCHWPSTTTDSWTVVTLKDRRLSPFEAMTASSSCWVYPKQACSTTEVAVTVLHADSGGAHCEGLEAVKLDDCLVWLATVNSTALVMCSSRTYILIKTMEGVGCDFNLGWTSLGQLLTIPHSVNLPPEVHNYIPILTGDVQVISQELLDVASLVSSQTQSISRAFAESHCRRLNEARARQIRILMTDPNACSLNGILGGSWVVISQNLTHVTAWPCHPTHDYAVRPSKGGYGVIRAHGRDFVVLDDGRAVDEELLVSCRTCMPAIWAELSGTRWVNLLTGQHTETKIPHMKTTSALDVTYTADHVGTSVYMSEGGCALTHSVTSPSIARGTKTSDPWVWLDMLDWATPRRVMNAVVMSLCIMALLAVTKAVVSLLWRQKATAPRRLFRREKETLL